MHKILLLLLSAAFLLPAAALEIAAPLTLVPSSSTANKFNVNVAASIATGSGTTNASGTMNVRMQVDPATGKVNQLSFEQGRIAFSNMNIPLNAFGFVTVARINTAGLEGFAWTPAPPAPVNPTNGAIDASLHSFTVDKGTVNGEVTSSFIPGVPQGTTFSNNFAETPLSGTGEGIGTVALVEIPASATTATRTWKTTLTLPLNILQTSDLNGTAVTIRFTGTLRAESNVVVPRNGFYQWSLANSLPTPAFDSQVRPGEPYGLVWAMGLAPTASLRPHLPVIALAGGPRALISLPPAGTAAPLIVEISDLLSTGSWSPAPAAAVSIGANPLPAGTSGSVSVQLSGPKQFVRLRANAP